MQIIFVRHGESQANVARIISNRNLPHRLTETGLQQAQALSEQLRSRNIEAIYASPILRAQQTAEILAEERQLVVQTADALREFDCGIMEGRGDAAAWQAHEAVIQAWDQTQDYKQRIPGGESFNDLQHRFVPFVTQVVETGINAKADVLLVSHGSLLHHLLPVILTNVDRAFSQAHPLRNCASVIAVPMPETLSCLEWDGTPVP